jgi:hypothetical protein
MQLPEGRQLTRTWVLASAAICFAVALLADSTVLPDRGKAVGYALFLTVCIIKTFQDYWREIRALLFLGFVAAFHASLIYLLPTDRSYSGVLLMPAAIADGAIFYYLFGLIVGRTPSRSTPSTSGGDFTVG